MHGTAPAGASPPSIVDPSHGLPGAVGIAATAIDLGTEDADGRQIGQRLKAAIAFHQRTLLCDLVRHVANIADGAGEIAMLVAQAAHHHLDMADGSIAVHEPLVQRHAVNIPADQPPIIRKGGYLVVFYQQSAGGPSKAFIHRIAGHVDPGAVEKQPFAPRIGLEHDLAHILQHLIEQVAALQQLGSDRRTPLQHGGDRQTDHEAGDQKQLQRRQLVPQIAIDQHDRAATLQRCRRCNDRYDDDGHRRPQQTGTERGHQHQRTGQKQQRITGLAENRRGHEDGADDQLGPVYKILRRGTFARAPAIDENKHGRHDGGHGQGMGRIPFDRTFLVEPATGRRKGKPRKDRRDCWHGDADAKQDVEHARLGDIGVLTVKAPDHPQRERHLHKIADAKQQGGRQIVSKSQVQQHIGHKCNADIHVRPCGARAQQYRQ